MLLRDLTEVSENSGCCYKTGSIWCVCVGTYRANTVQHRSCCEEQHLHKLVTVACSVYILNNHDIICSWENQFILWPGLPFSIKSIFGLGYRGELVHVGEIKTDACWLTSEPDSAPCCESCICCISSTALGWLANPSRLHWRLSHITIVVVMG